MISALLLLLQLTTYDQLTSVLVAPNLNARTQMSLGSNIYTQCLNDPAIQLSGDLFFEPWPASVAFHVRIWYSPTDVDGVTADGTANPAGLSAVYLGATGEDLVGQGNQTTASGTPDLHIQLRGLAGTPTQVQIIGIPSGFWQTPFNGSNWIIASSYGKPANLVERCNSRAIYEMTKDCVVRYQGLFGELASGKIRSQKTLNERLKFYQIQQWPPGAPGITIP